MDENDNKKRQKPWLGPLLAIGVLAMAFLLLHNNPMSLTRETALPADWQAERAEEPAVAGYPVSEAFFEVYLDAWLGEVYADEGAGEDWKLDAALRACVNTGMVETALYKGHEVQAVEADKVAASYRLLFREEVPGYKNLPLAEYSEAEGLYYLSPYLGFTSVPSSQVYGVLPRGENAYEVSACVTRGTSREEDGFFSLAGAFSSRGNGGDMKSKYDQVQAVIEVDEAGAVLRSIEFTRKDNAVDALEQLEAFAKTNFAMESRYNHSREEERVSGLLQRLTGGVAPPSFEDIASQGGEAWLQAGLLGCAEYWFPNRSAAYWQGRCADIFNFSAYGQGHIPLVDAETLGAFGRELYGFEIPLPTWSEGKTEGRFAFDANTGYYTVNEDVQVQNVYVWGIELDEEEGRCIAVASFYSLEYFVGGETNEAWIEEVLLAYPEKFVTVEIELEKNENGYWLPVSARRAE